MTKKVANCLALGLAFILMLAAQLMSPLLLLLAIKLAALGGVGMIASLLIGFVVWPSIFALLAAQLAAVARRDWQGTLYFSGYNVVVVFLFAWGLS